MQEQNYSVGGATPTIILPVSVTPYVIKLTVTDSGGLTDTDTVAIIVEEYGTAQNGSLQVTIFPQDAINAGAQWRVNDGDWRESEAFVSNLAVGSYTIEFKAIDGWATPANKTVQINEGQTTNEIGAYTQQTGFLQVIISPQEAVETGAQWRVDGGSWQNSGVTVSGLSVGNHTVEFKPAIGWDTPSSRTVQVFDLQTTNTIGTYSQQTAGLLGVTISTQGVSMLVPNGVWMGAIHGTDSTDTITLAA